MTVPAYTVPYFPTIGKRAYTFIASDFASDEESMQSLRDCIKGHYQTALLKGTEAWSGATLTGKAKKYGQKYGWSRDNLLHRMDLAGIPYCFVRGYNQRLICLVGINFASEIPTVKFEYSMI